MVTCAPPSAALSAFSAKWDLRSRSVNQKLGNKENLLLIQITQHLYNHTVSRGENPPSSSLQSDSCFNFIMILNVHFYFSPYLQINVLNSCPAPDMIDYLNLNIIPPARASHTEPGGVRSRLKSACVLTDFHAEKARNN